MPQKRVRNGKTRWVGRYRDPAGREHSKTFDTRREAAAWEAEREREIRRGEWVNTSDAPTLGQLWGSWEKAASTDGTRAVRHRVGKNLGDLYGVQITRINAAMLRTWLVHLRDGRPWVDGCVGLAENTRAAWWGQLVGCFGMAVDDQLLLASPTSRVQGPRASSSIDPAKLPTVESVAAAIRRADESGREVLATMIMLAACTGMRAGEVGGLRPRSVDLRGMVVHVVEQSVVKREGREPEWAPLKSASARRSIPIPPAMKVRLAGHMLRHPADADDVLFRTPTGRGWTSEHISHAMKALGGPRFHDLRHLYASSLIRRGMGVKAVQAMLGHASATLTLDTYAHLWPDEHERVRDAAGGLLGDVLRDQCGTDGDERSV